MNSYAPGRGGFPSVTPYKLFEKKVLVVTLFCPVDGTLNYVTNLKRFYQKP